MRPNRVQPLACRAAVAAALGDAEADAVLRAAGVADLPDALPPGPRDHAALARELAPFVALYRELLRRVGSPDALAIIRRAIVDSGLVSHAADARPGQQEERDTGSEVRPLALTSPPPPGFSRPPEELAAGFDAAMRFFSCDGELLAYTPDLVHFRVTGCNWCRAMREAGAPELIPFFCETDERFMDGHPTHALVRPTAIGLGDACCDFRFVRKQKA